MDSAKLRAWWWSRQGLDGSLRGAHPAAALEQSGWARSVAGVGPYLTVFSRAGTLRADVDKAVSALEIHELPAARGCTYVLPASDFAIGLKLSQSFADAPMRVARSVGVTDEEVERLGEAVLRALGSDALSPEEIRTATGDASRNLGDAGKKKGLTTTLPLALGLLQARGAIRRVPVNGRLDQQRYRYTRWSPGPLDNFDGTSDDAYLALARKFFGWIGPATIVEFQQFAGLGVKAARDIVARLGVVPAEPGSDRLLLPEHVDAYRSFKVPKEPQYALLSSVDSLLLARRDVRGLLDAADQQREIKGERSMLQLGMISDLLDHAIVDRGRVVGLWQFDTTSSSIVWTTFGVDDAALRAAIASTEAYIRDHLGDARSFSLDSPKSRQPRIDWIRKVAGT